MNEWVAEFPDPNDPDTHSLRRVSDPRHDADGLDAREVSIDLRSVWSAIYRNRFLILIVVLLSVAGGLAVTMLSTPIYRATASVQIEEQAQRVLESQDIQPVASQDAERFLQTQLDILRSRSLAERVARSLKLYDDNRFLIAMGMDLEASTAPGLAAKDAQRRAVIAMLLDNLEVAIPRDSRVATVSFDSPSSEMAARVANSFSANFISGNMDRKYDASSYARRFLEEQLGVAKQRLEDSERATIAYARSARLIDASAGASGTNASESGPRSLVTASLVQLNNSLSAALSARVAAEERWRQAQSTPLMSLPEVQNSTAVQALLRQSAELAAAYREERQRRKEDFPSMLQSAAELRELNAQIAQLANSAKLSIRDQYLVARQQEAALRANLARMQGETLSEQDRSVRYNILRREADTNRTLYDGLLQRFKEVSAAAGVSANNISMIDNAEIPLNPVWPRPLVNLALAGLLGFLASLALILGRETYDDAIRSTEDVDRKLGTPFLGTVPLLPSGETPQSALADARSAFSEAYYALQSSVELSSAKGLPRSILCTSSQQAEGKSTTSSALAKAFARAGRSVLLIDGDLRKPSLHRIMGLSNDRGLTTVLSRNAAASDVVQSTDIENLSFIACGPLPPNPAELLVGSSLRNLIGTFTAQYDLVLIDGPPVMGLADAPLLAASVEATIFVVEANRSHRGQAKLALRRLRSGRSEILGVVLTKYDARAIGYGADYGYSYQYGITEKRQPRMSRFFGSSRDADAAS